MTKKLIKLRNFVKINISSAETWDSEDYDWKKEVIDSHFDTSQLAKRVLEESRIWRKRLEKSWDEARKVIDIWSDYEDRFKTSLVNLSMRIDEHESMEAEKKRKQEELNLKRNKIARATELSKVRKREKFIPRAEVYSFRVR